MARRRADGESAAIAASFATDSLAGDGADHIVMARRSQSSADAPCPSACASSSAPSRSSCWWSVWALVAMALAQLPVIKANGVVEVIYYVVAGLGWVLPAMPLIRWMSRPDAAR